MSAVAYRLKSGKGRKARAERPAMSAEDARSFARLSVSSYAQIVEAIEVRRQAGIHETCTCEPYESMFTFNRWIAQGFSVRKGEKSIRFQTWLPVDGKADEDGNREPHLIPRLAFVFCRCQVDAK